MLNAHRDISWADGVLGQELGGQGLEEDRVTVLGRGSRGSPGRTPRPKVLSWSHQLFGVEGGVGGADIIKQALANRPGIESPSNPPEGGSDPSGMRWGQRETVFFLGAFKIHVGSPPFALHRSSPEARVKERLRPPPRMIHPTLRVE